MTKREIATQIAKAEEDLTAAVSAYQAAYAVFQVAASVPGYDARSHGPEYRAMHVALSAKNAAGKALEAARDAALPKAKRAVMTDSNTGRMYVGYAVDTRVKY